MTYKLANVYSNVTSNEINWWAGTASDYTVPYQRYTPTKDASYVTGSVIPTYDPYGYAIAGSITPATVEGVGYDNYGYVNAIPYNMVGEYSYSPTIVNTGTVINGLVAFEGNYNISNSAWGVWPPPVLTKSQMLVEKLKTNLTVIIKSRAELSNAISPEERVAVETLREFISETEFRKYMRYGFILVKGKSGDTFQVFRNRSHTKVWRNGQVVEEVCVRIQDSMVPPTDNVIAFRSIIQSDEETFRKLGNVYKMKKAA